MKNLDLCKKIEDSKNLNLKECLNLTINNNIDDDESYYNNIIEMKEPVSRINRSSKYLLSNEYNINNNTDIKTDKNQDVIKKDIIKYDIKPEIKEDIKDYIVGYIKKDIDIEDDIKVDIKVNIKVARKDKEVEEEDLNTSPENKILFDSFVIKSTHLYVENLLKKVESFEKVTKVDKMLALFSSNKSTISEMKSIPDDVYKIYQVNKNDSMFSLNNNCDDKDSDNFPEQEKIYIPKSKRVTTFQKLYQLVINNYN